MPGERGNTFFEQCLRKRIGSTATPNNSSINSTASQNGFISRYLSNIHASYRLRIEETLWYVHFNEQDFLTGLSQTVVSLTSSWQTFLTGILIRMLILHFQQWFLAMHADGFKEELKTDTRQMEQLMSKIKIKTKWMWKATTALHCCVVAAGRM